MQMDWKNCCSSQLSGRLVSLISCLPDAMKVKQNDKESAIRPNTNVKNATVKLVYLKRVSLPQYLLQTRQSNLPVPEYEVGVICKFCQGKRLVDATVPKAAK